MLRCIVNQERIEGGQEMSQAELRYVRPIQVVKRLRLGSWRLKGIISYTSGWCRARHDLRERQ